MKIIPYDKINWTFNKRENIEIGWTEKFEFKGFDVAHAKLKPSEALSIHFHDRKDEGDELFFFYSGGHIKVITEEKEEVINSKKPFYTSFSNREAHEVINMDSNEDLEFVLIYSPPFDPEEVSPGIPSESSVETSVSSSSNSNQSSLVESNQSTDLEKSDKDIPL